VFFLKSKDAISTFFPFLFLRDDAEELMLLIPFPLLGFSYTRFSFSLVLTDFPPGRIQKLWLFPTLYLVFSGTSFSCM